MISSRGEGLKALCVRLTRSGFNQIYMYHKDAQILGVDPSEYAMEKIRESIATFYCQIPSKMSLDSCVVVELRGSDEVIRQITHFITHDKPDDCWISR